MDSKNLYIWIIFFPVLFNAHCCSSDCDIKEIRNDPIFSYSLWDLRHGRYPIGTNRFRRQSIYAKGKFVKRTYEPTIEIWISPKSSFNYFLIKTEETDEWLQIPDNKFKLVENVWTHISFKSWYSEQFSENQCMSAAIVKDEYVVKQVLKCPKNVEALNFIQLKEIYVNGEADFSFDCDPTKEISTTTTSNVPVMISPITPQLTAINNSVSMPTYSQMATAVVLLIFIALIFLFFLVQLMIFRNKQLKRSMKGNEPEGMLMAERTITSVENNYEEIKSPELENPTAPNMEDALPCKPKCQE